MFLPSGGNDIGDVRLDLANFNPYAWVGINVTDPIGWRPLAKDDNGRFITSDVKFTGAALKNSACDSVGADKGVFGKDSLTSTLLSCVNNRWQNGSSIEQDGLVHSVGCQLVVPNQVDYAANAADQPNCVPFSGPVYGLDTINDTFVAVIELPSI